MSSDMSRMIHEYQKARAMSGTGVEVRFGFEITKVDTSQRLIEGWATSEICDAQGDIIPYNTARSAIDKLS